MPFGAWRFKSSHPHREKGPDGPRLRRYGTGEPRVRTAERGEHVVGVRRRASPSASPSRALPSASITNVERSTPMYVLPYIDFSTQTP